MKNRGLSDVVTTVLIILLVLAAVVLVWGFIRYSLERSGSYVQTEQFSAILKIEPRSVMLSDTNSDNKKDTISFVIKRDAGKGKVIGARYILIDSNDKNILKGYRKRIERI